MIVHRSICAAAFVLIGAAAAAAQEPREVPLGEVARQAEAAKPAVKKARKAYTNADLGADVTPAAVSSVAKVPAAPSKTGAPSMPVSADQTVARSDARGEDKAARPGQPESFWRQRAESIRGQIAKLQTQIDELSVPNIKRDSDPGQSAHARRMIANAQEGIDGLMKQWARLEDSGREEKIPVGWLDPRPARQ
jgi:hypothetical protein